MSAFDEDPQQSSEVRELVGREVLVVDGDAKVHAGMIRLLAPAGLHVTTADDPETALELCATRFFGVVVIDLDTPAPNAGLELVKKVHEKSPTSRVLVLSPRKSFDAAVSAFRAGAHDVVVKAPDQVEHLKKRVLAGAVEASARGKIGPLLVEVRDVLDDFLRRFMECERRVQDLEDRQGGRDPAGISAAEGVIPVLVVDPDGKMYRTLAEPGALPGFTFVYAQSGGEALDRVTNLPFQLALVGPQLPDLPGSMLVKALRTQAPQLMILTYQPGGKLEIVETTRTIPLLEEFGEISELRATIDQLADAQRAKLRERRYLTAFRERHYEMLRRFAEIKRKLETRMP